MSLGELIYTPEKATGEAITKAESHTPKIEAPTEIRKDQPFTIKISVGPHPNKLEHSIRKIEAYLSEEERKFNPIHLTTITLTPHYTEPNITITLKLKKNSTLHVLAYCNLHGI